MDVFANLDVSGITTRYFAHGFHDPTGAGRVGGIAVESIVTFTLSWPHRPPLAALACAF